ncbi:MAG: CHRD domain-containing protein [Ramlibacter sp.]|nr:CHRD domain-containing protein [Ramlibacter sp.]
MIRHTVLRTAFAAGLVALAVTGCGQMRPSQKMDIYEATLDSTQEVPSNTSAGRGAAEVQFNSSTNALSWKVTYSGLSGAVTGAHIHGPAAPGSNAGIVVPFSGNLDAQPMQGQATLTPTQFGDLAAGLWYVNLHTAQFPGGEIRGQLRRRQ